MDFPLVFNSKKNNDQAVMFNSKGKKEDLNFLKN